MKGRLEHELQINEQIKKILAELPKEVAVWNATLEAGDVTPSSRKDYVYKISKFINALSKNPKQYKLSKITKNDVIIYLQTIRTKEISVDGKTQIIETSDSYRNSIWYCLNNFFQFLFEEGIIQENYIKSIKKGKNHDLERINENRVLLTGKDLRRIIKAVECETDNYNFYNVNFNNRNSLIFYLFISTGMRLTALTEINLEDINIKEKILQIVDKGNKHHTYILNNKTIETLNKWLIDREELLSSIEKTNNALFITHYGNRINADTVRQLVKKYTEIATGKALSPHKLRAAFVSSIYNETHDIEFVRRAVGHANVATTQRYIVTDKSERKQSADIMERLLKIAKPVES